MKKDVTLTIRGTQRIDGDEETVELFTCGQLFRRNGSYWISYDESETTGFAGHHTTLHIEKDRVTMRRSGKSNSSLVIEKGARHLCTYDTGYGELCIGISGSFVSSSLDDNGGNVDFGYSMDIDAVLQSEQRVTIRVSNDTAALPQS